MGLRIAPDLYSTLLAAVTADQNRLNTDLQQVSTGQSVTQPSDNPAATAAYIENQTQASSADQYSKNISTIEGGLQTADTALGSVINGLQQAISLGTEGANGTNTNTQLQALAQQVQSIQQTILGLANTSYQGSYIFAGTDPTTAPYVASTSSPSGVVYMGNAGVNSVEVGPGQSVSVNLPGSAIFNTSGADVFQALSDLSTALNTNTNIQGALSEAEAAFNNVDTKRIFYGNTIDALNTASNNLSQEELTLSTQASSLIAADPAKAASNLSQDEYVLQAALQGFASISQNTLLNYLKL